MEEKDTKRTGGQLAARYSFTTKQILFAAGIFVLIVIGLFAWKGQQVRLLHDAYAIRESKRIDSMNAQIEKINRRLLGVVGKAYAWAVRNDFMKDNLGHVDDYGNDLVKERNFLSIMVTDERGIVRSSTNKKFEGVDFRTFNSPYYLNVDSPIVHMIHDTLAIVASPLMNYSGKVGTVIIEYRVSKQEFIKL